MTKTERSKKILNVLYYASGVAPQPINQDVVTEFQTSVADADQATRLGKADHIYKMAEHPNTIKRAGALPNGIETILACADWIMSQADQSDPIVKQLQRAYRY